MFFVSTILPSTLWGDQNFKIRNSPAHLAEYGECAIQLKATIQHLPVFLDALTKVPNTQAQKPL